MLLTLGVTLKIDRFNVYALSWLSLNSTVIKLELSNLTQSRNTSQYAVVAEKSTSRHDVTDVKISFDV